MIPLTIYYDLSETGEFITGEGTDLMEQFNFSGGVKEVTWSILITTDDTKEDDGMVTLTLKPDTATEINYTVAPSPDNSAEATVYDDDSPPKISVVAANGSVNESAGEVAFKLTATGIKGTSESLFVNATADEVVDTDDFLTDSIEDTPRTDSIQFTDPDGDATYHSVFNVPLHNDAVGELSGQLKLTLNEDPEITDTYRLGSTTEGFITVIDDEAPVLSIADGVLVTEAPEVMAEFPITASFNADEIMVYYTPTETGNFIGGTLTAGTTTSTELDFESGTSATLSIPVASDDVPEPDGFITVTLVADQKMENNLPVTTYGVAASPANAGAVMIQDDDSLPAISILADSGEVAESVTGGKANFKLTATGLSADTTLNVNATPAEDGHDFITNAVADTAADFAVDFSDPDGDLVYTGELPIDLDNDTTGEETGTFKLTLNTDTASPATYQLGATTEGTISVLDDDAPELSITGGEQVVEGTGVTADFTVSAKTTPNSYITVRYDLTESQDFIHHEGTGKSKILDFTNGKTDATLSITLVNDTKFEDNGSITVTLVEDTNNPFNYTVAASPENQASVNIIDDESLPMIWVSTDSGDVAENAGPARFKLIATGLFETTTLMINATPCGRWC